jgi:hypothetical protein
MNEQSFLPDGKPVEAKALANIQFSRNDLMEIAAGANPATFFMPANIEPAWGLLYVTADALGFFVHPSESPMALLFRNSKDSINEAINLVIPFADVTKAELIGRKPPRTSIGVFLRKYSSKPLAEFCVAWKSADGERETFFFIAKDLEEFAAAISKHIAVKKETGSR